LDEETFSESNLCLHSTGPFFSDKKDNDRTIPQPKEKATGPLKKRRGSGKREINCLLYKHGDAALACGVSSRTWRNWHRMAINPHPIVISKTNFWRVDELEKWVAAGCPQRDEWTYRPTMDAAKKLSNFSR